MSNIETLVKSSQWGDLASLLEEQWNNSEPTAQEFFFRSLAAFGQDDLFTAYNYGIASFEKDGDVAEVAEYLASLTTLVGRVKESYFYRKLLSILEKNEELNNLIPEGLIPDYTELLSLLEDHPLLRRGIKHELQFEWDEAEHWFLQHISFEPSDKNGYLAMIRCQISQERYRAASETIKGARALFPTDETFASMLGDVLTKLGQFDSAEACYKWAMDCAPVDDKVHVRYIRGLTQNPKNSFSRCVDEIKAWSEQHLQEIRGAMPPAALGERNFLRVGFLVSGLDRTRIAPAVGEVMSWHNDTKFQFFGYGEGDLTVPYNRYFKTAFEEWRDISGTDAMTLRNMVIADGIDILIDMGGLNSAETMLCFGSRLAPVQALWSENKLPGVLPEIDYVISDRVQNELKDKQVTVKGSATFSSCREALEAKTKEDAPTFVADADFSELSSDTVSLWAKVLLQNPDSMLLLRSHDFYAEDNSRELIEMFGIFGVAHRVDIIDESDRRNFFMHGDVALAPLQGCVGEVVLDALVGGTPILSCLAGDQHKTSANDLLAELGFGDELLYENVDDFVSAATKWMKDSDLRASFKAKANDQMMKTLHFNHKERMSHIEDMLNSIWQRKCAGEA